MKHTAAFIDICAAADCIGPSTTELPNYVSMIREVCQPQSVIQRAIREVPATGHPSRYFVETGAAKPLEKSAYLKALVCSFDDPFDAEAAVGALWALHCDRLLFGNTQSPDAAGEEYCGLMNQLKGRNALEVARKGLIEYHWLSDPLPRVFQRAEPEEQQRFVVVKFGAVIVKPEVQS